MILSLKWLKYIWRDVKFVGVGFITFESERILVSVCYWIRFRTSGKNSVSDYWEDRQMFPCGLESCLGECAEFWVSLMDSKIDSLTRSFPNTVVVYLGRKETLGSKNMFSLASVVDLFCSRSLCIRTACSPQNSGWMSGFLRKPPEGGKQE